MDKTIEQPRSRPDQYTVRPNCRLPDIPVPDSTMIRDYLQTHGFPTLQHAARQAITNRDAGEIRNIIGMLDTAITPIFERPVAYRVSAETRKENRDARSALADRIEPAIHEFLKDAGTKPCFTRVIGIAGDYLIDWRSDHFSGISFGGYDMPEVRRDFEYLIGCDHDLTPYRNGIILQEAISPEYPLYDRSSDRFIPSHDELTPRKLLQMTQ